MTRIIAGSVGGRTIAVPPRGTRPTSDRAREALFTKLDHHGLLTDAVVLDLYAGSGALGLEAASRGAARVDLVERDRRAAQICRDNTRLLRLDHVRTHQQGVEAFLAAPGVGDVTLALVDPPYDVSEQQLATVLQLLLPWLTPDAVVVVERSTRSPAPTLPPGLAPWDVKRYGDTALHLLDRMETPE